MSGEPAELCVPRGQVAVPGTVAGPPLGSAPVGLPGPRHLPGLTLAPGTGSVTNSRGCSGRDRPAGRLYLQCPVQVTKGELVVLPPRKA